MSTSTPTVPTSPQPYGICNDCGVEHVDRDAMTEHGHATMTPTGATSGVIARGHSSRVVNPTPEEVEARRLRYLVSSAIDDAIESAFDSIDRRIRRGDVTEDAVTDEIAREYPDLTDAWAEWVSGGAR